MASTGDDADDYMSMTFADPKAKQSESSLQRRARKQREAEIKGRTKSKAEHKADEAAQREAALTTEIDASNKGFQLLAKMGYKPGSALGKSMSESARTQPIQVSVKQDRGGIGRDAKRKRGIREAAEQRAKKVKADEGDYRERMRLEREERKLEGQLIGAQKVAEDLDIEAIEKLTTSQPDVEANAASTKRRKRMQKPLSHISVLYRGLVRSRREREHDQRVRKDLYERLNANRYNDEEEDEDDQIALNKEPKSMAVFDNDDLDADDPELDEFEALPIDDRLEKLVLHLRSTHNYCFWCKTHFPDRLFEGCPGTTEDDHD